MLQAERHIVLLLQLRNHITGNDASGRSERNAH